MRKIEITLFLIIMLMASIPGAVFSGMDDYLRAKDNEVGIGYSDIEIPLNRIVLIRKDRDYCAVKFTRHWTELDQERMKEQARQISMGGIIAESAKESATKKYAAYNSYCQRDGSGDFSKPNVATVRDVASSLPRKGPFRPFIYNPGDASIKVGPYKLTWGYPRFVAFIPSGKGMGEYGFELAPTPWIDLRDVRTGDPRIIWYKYDARRQREFVAIDSLWETLHKDRGNDVLIANNGIEVPLGRILLIRNDFKYCAVRFKKYWTENNGKEMHSLYESFYLGTGTHIADGGMKMTEDTVVLISPQKESSPLKRPYAEQVKCGSSKLYWEGNGFVSFYFDDWDKDYPRAGHSIELAPTPWTDASQINVHDSRIKWYKNSRERRNVRVAVDNLWESD